MSKSYYKSFMHESVRDVLLDVLDIFGHVESKNIGVFVMIPQTYCRVLSAYLCVFHVIRQEVRDYLAFVVLVDADRLEDLWGFKKPIFVIDCDIDLNGKQHTLVEFQFLSTKSSTLSYFLAFNRLLFLDFERLSSAMSR